MNIIKNLRKPYLAMFLASLVLFVSCEQYDNEGVINDSIENSFAKFSGQELFSSIIFMDGEATTLFPIIEDNFNIKEYLNSPDKKSEYKDMQRRAIEFIQKENSSFFENFQKSMYSQNPIVIKESILKAANILRPFLNEELKGKGLDYDITINSQKEIDKLKLKLKEESVKNEDNSAKEDASLVFALAAVVVVVAAVAFYVVVISEFAIGIQSNGDSDLFSEELSFSIVTGLSNNTY